jgi:molybdate transport repressor ModE-like protein
MSVLPDPYKFELSDDELRTLAKITLNWGHAESAIGLALVNLCRIDQETAKLLIQPLTVSRKIDLLLKLSQDGKISDAARHFVSELKYARDNFKEVRNIYSHGLVMSAEDGSRSVVTPKGQVFNLEELMLALEQSKYVGLAANRVLFAVLGMPIPEPWPERPGLTA